MAEVKKQRLLSLPPTLSIAEGDASWWLRAYRVEEETTLHKDEWRLLAVACLHNELDACLYRKID